MSRSLAQQPTQAGGCGTRRWFRGVAAAVWLLGMAACQLSAAYYEVTTLADGVDSSAPSGAGTPEAPFLVTTLRTAVIEVNKRSGGDTIILPAGIYDLTLPGNNSPPGEGELFPDDSVGDLDIIANNTTIVGAGAATTIIQQQTPLQDPPSHDRIVEVNGWRDLDFQFDLQGVTLRGGSTPAGGGALVCGGADSLTRLEGCVFESNRSFGPASGGGAILLVEGGILEIEACRFVGNTSVESSGGAISFLASSAPGQLTVSGSVFQSNLSGNHGGAINVAGLLSSPAHISNCSFIANEAMRQGGAVPTAASGAAVILEFNRLIGNTSLSTDVGRTLHQSGLAPMTADDNWWGINTGPELEDVRGLTIARWLQLRFAAEATLVSPGTSTVLTADLLGRNDGGELMAADLADLPAFPDSGTTLFTGSSLGSLSDPTGQLVAGTGSTGFIADQGVGHATAEVTVDGQSLVLELSIPTTVAGINALDLNPTDAAEVRWGITFAHPLDGLTDANFELESAGLSGGLVISSVVPDDAVPTPSWTVAGTTGQQVGTLRLNLLTDAGLSAPIAGLPFNGETYEVIDSLPPEILCAPDRTVACGDVWDFDTPTATDARDPAPSIGILSTETNLVGGGTFEVTRTWVAADSSGNSASCSQTITVEDGTPLTAGTDLVSVLEGEELRISIADLLANDTDDGGAVPTLAAVSPVSVEGGGVLLESDSVVYSPAAGFDGADQFSYTITDGCGQAQGIVRVTVLDAEAPGLYRLSVILRVGVPHLEFVGAPHHLYVVQRGATPLGPWTDLTQPLTPDPAGLIVFDETDGPLPVEAFYRVVETL